MQGTSRKRESKRQEPVWWVFRFAFGVLGSKCKAIRSQEALLGALGVVAAAVAVAAMHLA
jgi:hypothetical protein